MGRSALSAWILRLFAIAICAGAPLHALAAATAQGVALSASAGCAKGDLDLTLTTAGATSEGWQATTLAGAIGGGVQPTVNLANFSGTFVGFSIPLSPQQPPNTLVGSYAYVGTGPADPGNTAEFFVYYSCTTRQVLLRCFGPYGTCPQSATQAQALLAPHVPALSAWALLLTGLLVATAGARAVRRRV